MRKQAVIMRSELLQRRELTPSQIKGAKAYQSVSSRSRTAEIFTKIALDEIYEGVF